MKLHNNNNCLIINEVFPPEVVAGFTTREFSATFSPEDCKGLFSLAKRPEVSFMNQIHSARVHTVRLSGTYEGDGLFSEMPNHLLAVKTADCLPLLFLDRHANKIGAVHMGWRSARLGILESIPGDLDDTIVVAGVGLRNCCYEVGEEFLGYEKLNKHLFRRGDRLYFDPVAFVRGALTSKGMRPENFHDINFCSFCMDAGFSYRKNSTQERIVSFIIRR